LGQVREVCRNPLQTETLNGMWNPKSPEQRRTRRPSWPSCCADSPGYSLLQPVTPPRTRTEPSAWRRPPLSSPCPQDFVYRRWKRLGGYKDTDHHIKFRMSDLQRHLERKAKDGRPCG
jgi:hypothetical protein